MDISIQTRWAPTTYKWGYNPYKWSDRWVTGVINRTLLVNITTSFITGFSPRARLNLVPRAQKNQSQRQTNRANQHFAVEISSLQLLNSTAFCQHQNLGRYVFPFEARLSLGPFVPVPILSRFDGVWILRRMCPSF